MSIRQSGEARDQPVTPDLQIVCQLEWHIKARNMFMMNRCIDLIKIRMHSRKLFFLFLSNNICCGYSKEPSQGDGSFEHPKHMFKLMSKKIITIYTKIFCLTGPLRVQNFLKTQAVVVTIFVHILCCKNESFPFSTVILLHLNPF